MNRSTNCRRGNAAVVTICILVILAAVWFVGETRFNWGLADRIGLATQRWTNEERESQGIRAQGSKNETSTRSLSGLETGMMMVPMRETFEAAGATVSYDQESGQAVAETSDTTMALSPGSQTAQINGETHQLEHPSAMLDGSLYVPLSLVEAALPLNVDVAFTEEDMEELR